MIRCWNLTKHTGFYSISHAGALPVRGHPSHAGAAPPVQGALPVRGSSSRTEIKKQTAFD